MIAFNILFPIIAVFCPVPCSLSVAINKANRRHKSHLIVSLIEAVFVSSDRS